MKALLPILILTLFLTACKTRQVATVHTETTTSEVLTKIVKRDSVKIDTGKVHTETQMAKNVQDSSQVIIQTDSGIQKITVTPNKEFVFIGKAKSITYKTGNNDHSKVNKVEQENKGQITKVTIADSTSDKKQVQELTKAKTSVAKPSSSWIWMLLAAGAIVAIGICLIRKFKVI